MSLLGDLLKHGFPLVLSGLKSLADGYVKGENLNKDQRQLLFSGYVVICVHGDELVESTANEYDDAGLDALKDFCVDTMTEAGIPIPAIPVELEA